jgi:hypothetical protein
MRTSLAGVLLGIGLISSTSASAITTQEMLTFLEGPKQLPNGSYEVAATCFATGEQTSGMNKICYYDCLGSSFAITVSSVALCPLTINR